MKNSTGIIAAFLGGALVGAALGLLFAPESGDETRRKIAEELEKRGIKFPFPETEETATEAKQEA